MSKVSTNHRKQSSPHNRVSTPPLPASHAPQLFESVKQGFGFGVGSSIANKLVNSMFSSKTEEQREQKNESVKIERKDNPSNTDVYELYHKCLEDKNNNVECNKILEKNSHEHIA